MIDEINRGDVSKIFGELITLIEHDKRGTPHTLAYSQDEMSVPENVFIIGTMNVSDRSLARLDVAFRRRFGFVRVDPDYSLVESSVGGVDLSRLLRALNDKIGDSLDDQNAAVGHSYFMHKGTAVRRITELQDVFIYDIVPLLQDYFYEDEDKIGAILDVSKLQDGDLEVVKTELVRIYEG